MGALAEVAAWIAGGALLAALSAAAYLTQPALFAGGAPCTELAEPARLRAHVERLAHDLGPRTAARPSDLAPAARYIRAELEALGLAVSEQPVEYEGDRYANLSAALGPEEGERVVVGAHYDAAVPGPGADDDASGVAGLLELARLLRALEPPAGRIELVAYTLEEDGLVGSEAHARALFETGARVRAMLSLEMIGWFSDAPGSQRYPFGELALLYPTTGDFIAVVGAIGHGNLARRVKAAMRRASPLDVYSLNAPRFVPGVTLSDHASYWEAGYPALMITDTAFFRNPNYHAPTDTPETLDYARMAQVVDGVCAAVQDLARP